MGRPRCVGSAHASLVHGRAWSAYSPVIMERNETRAAFAAVYFLGAPFRPPAIVTGCPPALSLRNRLSLIAAIK